MTAEPKIQTPDRTEIDVNDPEHVFYWTQRFAVSEAQLRDAVEHVGANAPDVAKLFKKPYPPA